MCCWVIYALKVAHPINQSINLLFAYTDSNNMHMQVTGKLDSNNFEKRRLRPISAYNVSTVSDSEKVQLWRIQSRPRAFKRAIDGVRTLTLSLERVVSQL